MKTACCWDTTPVLLSHSYVPSFRENILPSSPGLPWLSKQQLPVKSHGISTILHDVIWQKSVMRISAYVLLFTFSSIHSHVSHGNPTFEFQLNNEMSEWYVVFLLLGGSPASEFHVPTFRNTLFHLHRWCKTLLKPPMKMEHKSVPKRQYIKFRRRGITQKKEYNIQNMVKVWNQERDIVIVILIRWNYVSMYHKKRPMLRSQKSNATSNSSTWKYQSTKRLRIPRLANSIRVSITGRDSYHE